MTKCNNNRITNPSVYIFFICYWQPQGVVFTAKPSDVANRPHQSSDIISGQASGFLFLLIKHFPSPTITEGETTYRAGAADASVYTGV